MEESILLFFVWKFEINVNFQIQIYWRKLKFFD